MPGKNIELSVIIPTRNEEIAIRGCIEQALNVIKENKINGEIIISDSSIDRTAEIAQEFSVKIIKHNKKGYGKAYLEGFKHANGKYIFMADGDGTYDFRNIPFFLKKLKEGYDLVIGNRHWGEIEPGAMPFLSKIGNPLLSSLFRIFFNQGIGDVHCGMRAITREALDKLNLNAAGMEFASEMLIMASSMRLRIYELPVNYYKRKGKSKLKHISDGWRHLRFMLMLAPTYLFLVPGLFLLFIGLLFFEFLFFGYGRLIILGGFFIILGYQIILTGLYAKAYIKSIGLIKSDRFLDIIANFINFERGILIGGFILFLSFIIGLINTIQTGLNNNAIIIILVIAVIAVQTLFSTFLLSIMLIERK